MKNKIFCGFTRLALAVFIIAGLGAPTLAQEAQTPSVNADLEKAKNNIQNNSSLPDDQKKEMLFRLQNNYQGQGPSGTVNCFSFYRFGSVDVALNSETSSVFAGKKAVFTAQLSNENDYPIAQGNLWGQILRENPIGEATNGSHLIDQFLASDNIYLAPHENREVSFSYDIPKGLPEGKYFLAVFFTSSKSYEISGLASVNNVYASVVSFDVKNFGQKAIYIDRNNIRINDKRIENRSPVTEVSEESDVKINFPLVNERGTTEQVKLSYYLSLWDTFRSENIISKSSETVGMDANSTKDLQYIVPKIQSGTYQLRITAEYFNAQSMLEVRLTTDDTKRGRVNFAGLDKFPLTKGDRGKIFACFHNAGNGIGSDGEVIITLKDEKGKTVSQKNYKGFIPGDVSGIEQEFQANAGYDYLVLTSTAKDKEGKTVGEVSTIYDNRGKEASLSAAGGWKKILAIILGITALLAVIWAGYLYAKKRRIKTFIFILALAGLSAFSLLANNASAACNSSYAGQLVQPGLHYSPVFSGNLSLDPNCLFKKGDGTCVKNGDTLNVGEIISFSDPIGEWYGNGSAWGTPPYSRKWYSTGSDWFVGQNELGLNCTGSYAKDSSFYWCNSEFGDVPNYGSCDSVHLDPQSADSPQAYTCTEQISNPKFGFFREDQLPTAVCMYKKPSPPIAFGMGYIKDRSVSVIANNAALVGVNGEKIATLQPGTVTLTADPYFVIRSMIYYGTTKAICGVDDVPSQICTSGGFDRIIGGRNNGKSCYDFANDDIPSGLGGSTLLSVFYGNHHVQGWSIFASDGMLYYVDGTIDLCPASVTLNVVSPCTPNWQCTPCSNHQQSCHDLNKCQPDVINSCNSTPAVNISGPSSGLVNTNYTFSVAGTDNDLPTPDYLKYRINWGDGSTSEQSDWVASGTAHNFTHAYASRGNYTITAEATDNGTNWTSATNPFSVQCSQLDCATRSAICQGKSLPATCDANWCVGANSCSVIDATHWKCSNSCGDEKICPIDVQGPQNGKCGSASGTTICDGTSPQFCATGKPDPSSPNLNAYDVIWQCVDPNNCGGTPASCSARGSKACGWVETSP